ncbi:MAG: HlyD family efflux transporter periplasmic adaptor subunit [Verrucomicrobia bacterium]|nr:HlyD family efflux transporter periplasmic adaptor subunit [Verrucomicrobiota bacterium]
MTPIPTPAGTLFREFRIQAVPYIAFAMVVGITAWLWQGYVGPATWVGEVESVRGVVSSMGPGRLAHVQVDALQRVTAGQVLARVITVEPRILEAQISLSKARIDLIRVGSDSELRKQNSRVNLEGLRLDWMSKRVDWLSAKARSAYRQLELARLEKLRSGVTNGGSASPLPVLSQNDLDISRRDAAVEEAAVVELEQLVAKIGASIQQLSASRLEGQDSPSTSAAIEVESKNLDLLESQMMPIDLVAPFDGVVSVVHRWSGETIQAGEPILTVSQEKPSRVVSFIRQPIQVQTQPGMKVEVRARGGKREMGIGEVLRVGSQLEPISPSLLPRTSGMPAGGNSGGSTIENGLPVLVSLPANLTLYPGEVVDLRVVTP